MPEKPATNPLRALGSIALAIALVAIVAIPAVLDSADATHKPADKMATSGSTLEIMTSGVSNGSESQTATILSGTMKTSGPTDLIITVTAECALWTDVITVGNDLSHALAQVEVWVEIDGQRLLVSGQENPSNEDAGKVVFCNRDYKVQTLQFDDEDATIERYLRSRTANAFQWTALNVGSGDHDIVIKAQLEGQASEGGFAKAAIGKRSLTAEPVKLANDATL